MEPSSFFTHNRVQFPEGTLLRTKYLPKSVPKWGVLHLSTRLLRRFTYTYYIATIPSLRTFGIKKPRSRCTI